MLTFDFRSLSLCLEFLMRAEAATSNRSPQLALR